MEHFKLEHVNIAGLDKGELLLALTVGDTFGMIDYVDEDLLDDDALLQIARARASDPGLDYFRGRAIKTNLTQNVVDSTLYDRDAGAGQFARIVAVLKKMRPLPVSAPVHTHAHTHTHADGVACGHDHGTSGYDPDNGATSVTYHGTDYDGDGDSVQEDADVDECDDASCALPRGNRDDDDSDRF